jgi:uncharacterized protein DUF3375
MDTRGVERVFTPERPRVAVAGAHAKIDNALHQLPAGYGDEDNQPLPAGNARDLCRRWVHTGRLVPQVFDDAVEVYRLSAHGVDALEVAGQVQGVGVPGKDAARRDRTARTGRRPRRDGSDSARRNGDQAASAGAHTVRELLRS